MKQPKLKIFATVRQTFSTAKKAAPYLIAFFVFNQMAVSLLFKPLIQFLLSSLMKSKGYPVLINVDVASAFFSIFGILIGLAILIVSALSVFFEFSTTLHILQNSNEHTEKTLSTAIEQGVSSMRALKNLDVVGFILYSMILMPLFSFGMHAAVLPNLTIPSFIIGEIEKYPFGPYLIFLFVIIGLILAVRLLLVLPCMVFEKKNFSLAAKKSIALTKGNFLRILFVMFILFVLSVLIILVPAALFMELRGILALPLKAFSFLLITLVTIIFPATIVCVSYIAFQSLSQTTEEAALPAKETNAQKQGYLLKLWRWLQKGFDALIDFFFRRAPRWLIQRPHLLLLILIPIVLFIDIVVPLTIDPTSIAVIGHRGSTHGVENTLEAISGAIEEGANFVEIDVQLSKDQIPVVIHDTNLYRLSGENTQVYRLNAAQLTTIPIRNELHTGYIPTLDKVCEQLSTNGSLLIELKPHGKESESLVEQVMMVVEKHKMQERVIFQTSDFDLITECKLKYPQMKIGYIVIGYIGQIKAVDILKLGVDFLTVEESFASANLVAECHKADTLLYVWTVNDTNNVSQYVSSRVDGIITDYPARIIDALKKEP